jgi:hypothetical protein
MIVVSCLRLLGHLHRMLPSYQSLLPLRIERLCKATTTALAKMLHQHEGR